MDNELSVAIGADDSLPREADLRAGPCVRNAARAQTPSPVRTVVSVIVPCFNEEEVLPLLVERLAGLARSLDAEMNCDAEFLFVDDGSLDRTWELICQYAQRDRRVRGVRLSRNFGQQAALTCGYALAAGEAVVCLDADLQDPPELVPEMVAAWRRGADVVYAVRRQRPGESAFKLASAKAFYWLMGKLAGKHVRPGVSEFRLMSRRSVEALLALRERHRFLRGLAGWLGFPSAEVHYDRCPRAAGQTKWPLRKLVRLAWDAIVSFSQAPLRLAYYFAIVLPLPFLVYLCWRVVMHVWSGTPLVVGESFLLLAVIVFGAANLCTQAILGQYVGRIHQQGLGRPLYVIRECVGEEPASSAGSR